MDLDLSLFSKHILSSIGERTVGLVMEAAGWLNVQTFSDCEAIKTAYLDTLDSKMAAEDAVIFDAKNLTR